MRIHSVSLAAMSLILTLSCAKKDSKDSPAPPAQLDDKFDQDTSIGTGDAAQNDGSVIVTDPTQSINMPDQGHPHDGSQTPGTGIVVPNIPVDTETVFRLVSAVDQGCALVDGESFDNNAMIKTVPCDESAFAHQWTFVPSVEGSFKLSNARTQKCLDVLEMSKLDTAMIAQYSCEENAPCQDVYVSKSQNEEQAINFTFRHSGMCLENRAGEVKQAACDGSAKQDWYLR